MKLAGHARKNTPPTLHGGTSSAERGRRAIDSSQGTARIWLATFQNEIGNSLGTVSGKLSMLLYKLKRSGLDGAGQKELSGELEALDKLLNALQQHAESFGGKPLPPGLKPLLIEGKDEGEVAALVCGEAEARVEAAIEKLGSVIGKFREKGADTGDAESLLLEQAEHMRRFVSTGKTAADTGGFTVVEHANDGRFIVEFGPGGGSAGRSEKL
jgi:hypothetical protein